jgi:hypothetical protein
MRPKPLKRRLKCGPEFRTAHNDMNVMPWNRLDQKMTLYLCESARRTLRQLHGDKRPHLVPKPEVERETGICDACDMGLKLPARYHGLDCPKRKPRTLRAPVPQEGAKP